MLHLLVMMSRFKLTNLVSGYLLAGSAPFVSQLVQLVSFNCRLTVGRLLCQALLVKVFVKIVDSRRLESEKVTNSLGLLGQNLLVYFEG